MQYDHQTNCPPCLAGEKNQQGVWNFEQHQQGWKDQDGSQNFFIYDALGGIRFLINSNGNVGIGVNTPANKLEVCGTIKASQFNVAANWCDFVFDTDYKLKSLYEVDKYIQQYKHLPNVPSAKEIETNGVDLGTMITSHMQKIEELTLYIIQQEKKIQQLELRLTKVEEDEK